MHATITILGSGTSMGVPTLGCDCAVCTSSDPRDRRTRPSIAVSWNDLANDRCVIIDTGPDFRTQALREGIRKVDAVFYTHSHADHILGLDDLRPLSFLNRERMPLYADDSTALILEKIFDYTFDDDAKYPTRARVKLHRLGDGADVDGVRFERVPLLHGELEVAGFRFGGAAYLTDMSSIPESSFALLRDLDVAIFDALRIKPHPSHSTLKQAIEWALRVGARQSYFTHMSHEIAHEEVNKSLPPTMSLAYDGLRIPFIIPSPAAAD
jgi:phosphoribosyl 1,2-cyclic phosphate phosphodiesterase